MAMAFPRKIEAVVFDLDGLLFDTEILFFDAMQAAGREAGHDITMELFLSLVGGNRDYNFRRMREYFGAAFPAEAFHGRCTQHMAMLVGDQLRLKTGVIELLDLLDHLALPRAIATSSPRGSVDHHLAAVGISSRFDAVVANGDYSRGKPHPEPYQMAAAQLGVAPSACLALEDSHNGVRSAAAAGMMTVMVPDLLSATVEMQELCVFVANDLHQVHRRIAAHGNMGII